MIVLLLALFVSGVLVVSVVATARWYDARAWREQLVTFALRTPNEIDIGQVATWLAAVSALTHAPRGALVPSPPLVIEVVGDRNGVSHQLRMPEQMQRAVLASLRAAMPGVRLEPVAIPARPRTSAVAMAAGLRLAGRHRQLAVERAEATSRGLLAALQPLRGQDRVIWQWVVTGAPTPAPVQQPRSGRGKSSSTALPWWLEDQAPADADGVRSARLKQRQPLVRVCGRLLVESSSKRAANSLFGTAWGAVRMLQVPGARLVRDFWPSAVVERQMHATSLPLLRWPLYLNVSELAGLLAFPLGEAPMPGVPLSVTRQIPPPAELGRAGTVLADSTYPGLEQPLRLATKDRLMHVACLGPTGTGKSTLMNNMALQDADRGDGLAVLDPKADMAADLIAHMPRHRWDDVIIVNPSDSARPVGFNVLANDGTEASCELAVDHVLHVFQAQWSQFWGPRTDAVLRAALLVLTSTRAADGSAFTVCELPALLTNTPFRQWVTAQPSVPVAVHEFWRWFESLSKAERTQVVGPVLNKLTALTQRTPIRLLLGQSDGLDLSAAIRDRKILLMPLSRGLVGAETAGLLSSLMMASLWQAALGRVRIPASKRHPWWLFVDEAAEVVRLPLDLTDVMAEARGLGVGLTMAMQHLSQLPTAVRHAMLATVRSQIVFQVEPADARVLTPAFAPTLTDQDLRNLPAHEVAMRLSIGGRTSRPMTGVTRPLPDATSDGVQLRQRSRNRFGQDRAVIEAGLAARLSLAAGPATTAYGQRPSQRSGDSS